MSAQATPRDECDRSPGSDNRPDAAEGCVQRKPPWLKVAIPPMREYQATADLLDDLKLHTVCTEAGCPNRGECFSTGTATFLILGDRCTRDCRFCAVGHGAPGGLIDKDEPRRVAVAAARLDLRHMVATSVTRDDLSDGGAQQFAAVIREVRAALPTATIEVLTPDFRGDQAALETVLAAEPDVFNHNVETVPRLYAAVRPAAVYARSLQVLRNAATWAKRSDRRRSGVAAKRRTVVKTGLMLGLGETSGEIGALLLDCRGAGVDIVTIGQYLRPAAGCAPVKRYVTPAEFQEWATWGERLGLTVVAGPFVRSSYRAGEALATVERQWRRRLRGGFSGRSDGAGKAEGLTSEELRRLRRGP